MKYIIGIIIFTAGLYFTIISFPSSVEVNSSLALIDGLEATVALRFFSLTSLLGGAYLLLSHS